MSDRHDEPAPKPLQSLGHDLPAGLVVFLVAVPLCLGIALASGAPLVSGLIAGIVGGLVVPLISRAELSVCGPAAGLAAVVLAGITTLGSFEALAFAVVLAGLLQIAFGLLRMGRIAGWFPSGVVGGMLAGIGVLIVMKQIPHAFGYDADPMAIEEGATHSFATAIQFISPTAIAVAVVSLVVLVGWDPMVKGSTRFLRLVPAPLAAVLVAVGLHEAIGAIWPSARLSSDHLVVIPPVGEWAATLKAPDLAMLGRADVWMVAATLAIVASLESLLNVEAMDRLDPWARRSPMNRELLAQGVANTLSGLLGGIPVTSVVVRSSAAMQAGGRTRMAAFSHGILMLVAVVLMAPVLARIPIACLASILIVTGYKLAKPAVLKAAYKLGPEHFVPFAATLIGVVAVDLLKGVIIGVGVALVFALRKGLGRGVHVAEGEGQVVIRLVRNVPFFARAQVQQALDGVPAQAKVVVDAQEATNVHRDVVETVKAFVASAPKRRVEIEVRGLPA